MVKYLRLAYFFLECGMFLACIDQSEKDRWLSKLDTSNWLLHVKEALTTACIVAQTIDCEGSEHLVGINVRYKIYH